MGHVRYYLSVKLHWSMKVTGTGKNKTVVLQVYIPVSKSALGMQNTQFIKQKKQISLPSLVSLKTKIP